MAKRSKVSRLLSRKCSYPPIVKYNYPPIVRYKKEERNGMVAKMDALGIENPSTWVPPVGLNLVEFKKLKDIRYGKAKTSNALAKVSSGSKGKVR